MWLLSWVCVVQPRPWLWIFHSSSGYNWMARGSYQSGLWIIYKQTRELLTLTLLHLNKYFGFVLLFYSLFYPCKLMFEPSVVSDGDWGSSWSHSSCSQLLSDMMSYILTIIITGDTTLYPGYMIALAEITTQEAGVQYCKLL